MGAGGVTGDGRRQFQTLVHNALSFADISSFIIIYTSRRPTT